MKLKLTFLFALLLTVNNYAQEKCGYAGFMQEKLQDPDFRTQYEAQQAAFEKEYERLLANPEELLQTIIIPVAVHFPQANESNRECLEELARDQIRILNEDFAGTNKDIADWEDAKNEYPGVKIGTLDVKFVLSTRNHPSGVDPDIVEGGPAVTIGNSVRDTDSRWAGYQNFVIKPIDGGVLGYSPLGGSPNRGASVVMNTFAFGSSNSGCPNYTAQRPYNLGRTVTHELGHFYNLNHTWGNGGCNSDDRVEDTPNISGPSFGCRRPGSINMCGNKSLTTNYMDYVDDRCMFMFTEGQAARMKAYINTIKDQWKTDVLSADSFAVNDVFSVYPNPANDEINISLISNVVKEASFEVYDIIGKTILTGDLSIDNNIKSRKIDTSELTNGVYLLKINSGNLTATKKIVVKH